MIRPYIQSPVFSGYMGAVAPGMTASTVLDKTVAKGTPGTRTVRATPKGFTASPEKSASRTTAASRAGDALVSVQAKDPTPRAHGTAVSMATPGGATRAYTAQEKAKQLAEMEARKAALATAQAAQVARNQARKAAKAQVATQAVQKADQAAQVARNRDQAAERAERRAALARTVQEASVAKREAALLRKAAQRAEREARQAADHAGQATQEAQDDAGDYVEPIGPVVGPGSSTDMTSGGAAVEPVAVVAEVVEPVVGPGGTTPSFFAKYRTPLIVGGGLGLLGLFLLSRKGRRK